jgi:hypothetical protein
LIVVSDKRTAELKQKEAQMAVLELRQKHPIKITAEKGLGDQMVDVKYRVPTVELIHTNE